VKKEIIPMINWDSNNEPKC